MERPSKKKAKIVQMIGNNIGSSCFFRYLKNPQKQQHVHIIKPGKFRLRPIFSYKAFISNSLINNPVYTKHTVYIQKIKTKYLTILMFSIQKTVIHNATTKFIVPPIPLFVPIRLIKLPNKPIIAKRQRYLLLINILYRYIIYGAINNNDNTKNTGLVNKFT